MTDRLIVSRHPAAVEFIARELSHGMSGRYIFAADGVARGPSCDPGGTPMGLPCLWWAPDSWRKGEPYGPYAHPFILVLASATAGDVRGKVVYGTLPLHLAALTAEYHAVEFAEPNCYTDGDRRVYGVFFGGDARAERPMPMGCPARWTPSAEEWDALTAEAVARMTPADLDAAGAKLVRYAVRAL